MSVPYLDAAAIRRALAIRDLTDPAAGAHAMQVLVADLHARLGRLWGCPIAVHRESPIVSVADNYDRLGYPPGGASRDARYTRYIGPQTLLRTQTSAMIPGRLRALAADPVPDVGVVCPGLVYRRDVIDRLHTGEPHQVDLWRIRMGRPLSEADLATMVGVVVDAVVPGREHRVIPADHPYTTAGRQIDVRDGDGWVEIGECGLAAASVLANADLDPRRTTGLAMGLGLDRVLMLRKAIPDIRLLRSEDPRVRGQLLDLTPYRAVSSQPAISRDLSIVVDAGVTAEELGDRVRAALGRRAAAVESVEVRAETTRDQLPAAVVRRLRLAPGTKNVLLRLVVRDLCRTLTDEEANVLRDEVYAAVHEGEWWEWASRRP